MDDRTINTPFEGLGGRERVEAIAERFYGIMEQTEPELTATHPLDEQGRITAQTRERFALFLVGWLGGPQEYMRRHGHPRLRMRHRDVPIDSEMRDAWMRCMTRALEEVEMEEDTREFLQMRFAHVADFMRNTPDEGNPS